MPDALIERMLDWIADRDPANLLLVAAPGHPLQAAIERTQPTIGGICVAPAKATADRLGTTVYDLAIVCDTLETRDKAEAQRLLGRLRDVQAKGVVVAAPRSAAHDWTSTDFIALGFKRWHGAPDCVSDWLLYRFNIYDYKDTPTWLSPRNWANPEQWDRHRW